MTNRDRCPAKQGGQREGLGPEDRKEGVSSVTCSLGPAEKKEGVLSVTCSLGPAEKREGVLSVIFSKARSRRKGHFSAQASPVDAPVSP